MVLASINQPSEDAKDSFEWYKSNKEAEKDATI